MFAGLAALLAGMLAAIAVYHAARPGALPLAAARRAGWRGLGTGCSPSPFFTAALHRVRPHETGSAAGLLNAVQQLGGTLGVAVLGTAFFHAFAPRSHAARGAAALGAIQLTFWIAAGLVAATAVTTVLMAETPARRLGGTGRTPGT